MRVKLGSVAFLKAAGSGYGIGLGDEGNLIEFSGRLARFGGATAPLAGPEPMYLDVDD